MFPESANPEEQAIASEILDYLVEHPQAEDTLEGIAQSWIDRRKTRVDLQALARTVDNLVERGDLEVFGGDPARRYRLCKPREMGYNGAELGRLATIVQGGPAGTGTLVVLAGPSKDQKSTAAEHLAEAMGQGLYRVDLSAVVSKYIGETEKNLNRLFARAEEQSAILFFDEADALFGKRADVKDSHDRLTTMEVASLLQRIDSVGAVVLISVNDPDVAKWIARRLRRARTVVLRQA